jgi:hypothetical protein
VSEDHRRRIYEVASQKLPPFDVRGWRWSDEELSILKKACAVRFDETVRTETLLWIAAAAIKIYRSRQPEETSK